MSFLAIILSVKICIIAFVTVIPLLSLPIKRLTAITGIGSEAGTLFRLYGVAIAALLVGYASGFWLLAKGDFPWGIVVMGIISNGGATAMLFATGAWRRTVSLTLFLLTITVALVVAAINPSFATRPLW